MFSHLLLEDYSVFNGNQLYALGEVLNIYNQNMNNHLKQSYFKKNLQGVFSFTMIYCLGEKKMGLG